MAIGTASPEIAVSLQAEVNGQGDLTLGNVLGQIFLICSACLGLSAFLAPDGISVAERVLRLDFLVMVFVALVCLPFFYFDNRISRVEGTLLLGYYVLYVTYVILQASKSSTLPAVTLFITFFAPITFVALVVVAVRSSRSKMGK